MTPDTLRRELTRWQSEFNPRRLPVPPWSPSGLPPLRILAGSGPAQRLYETTELIGEEEVQIERQVMRHRVGWYWLIPEQGHVSFWSLTATDPTGRVERLLTLKVRGMVPAIVEAQGLRGRPPTRAEGQILSRWIDGGGPDLGESIEVVLNLWEERVVVPRTGLTNDQP